MLTLTITLTKSSQRFKQAIQSFTTSCSIVTNCILGITSIYVHVYMAKYK